MFINSYTKKFQIYSEFRIFNFARFFVSGYGHRHISGSLNFIKIILRIFWVRPFSSMIYVNLRKKLSKQTIIGRDNAINKFSIEISVK